MDSDFFCCVYFSLIIFILCQYERLECIREMWPSVPIMALTATANDHVRNDIINRLKIRDCVQLVQSHNRTNLDYNVLPKTRNVIKDIADFIKTKHLGKTGIIYCFRKKDCEELAHYLSRDYGLRAMHFHADICAEDKERIQTEWLEGDIDIIVSTVRQLYCGEISSSHS